MTTLVENIKMTTQINVDTKCKSTQSSWNSGQAHIVDRKILLVKFVSSKSGILTQIIINIA